MRHNPRLAPFALCALLYLGACASGEQRSPLAPPSPELSAISQSSSSLPKEPFSTIPSHLVLLAEGITDPWFLLQDYGLEILVSLISGGLTGVSGELDLELLASDPRIRAVQTNSAISLTSHADLTMAFFEGSFDGSQIDERIEFAALSLDRVHRRGMGQGVRIAVLDTGVDPDHPHLLGRVEMEQNVVLGWPVEIAEGIDDDGDGLVDEAFGHGTHVAGIIATVAPEATLVPIRVLSSDGAGTAYELAVGIRSAIDRGVDVINLSVSLSDDATVVESLLRDAHGRGIAIVAAAGNSGGTPTFPAAYDFVLGSAATCVDVNQLAEFSARGVEIEMAAPGTSVLSSFPGGAWAEASGSSMAAAVLSGALAVVRSTSTALDSHLASTRVTLTAYEIQPEGSVLHGRVDLLRAVTEVLGPRKRLYQPTTLNGAH